uniref:Kinesin motor domain-containing protein n=1 Tax=Mesocestoides corti TaxID=53468 RepID=A0A5K3F0B6_MESCO
MWQDASIGCLLPSSNNVRLQSQEEIKKKLQQMRQQISSSSRLQTLKTEIDAATKDLNLAADNALLRANDHLTLIKKQETVTLEKAARKLFECWEEFKQLEQDSAHIRGCGKLAILLKYRQRARALIEGVKGIENLTDGFASPLRLMSVSTVFKMLSARLESTRLVYATTIPAHSDFVDEDWRWDASGPFSVEK